MERQIKLNTPFKCKNGVEMVWRGETNSDSRLYKCWTTDNRDFVWYYPNGAFETEERRQDFEFHAEWYGVPEPPSAPPPLGLKPRSIHDGQRRDGIKEAMLRYMDANKSIPPEWLEEYNELTARPQG